MALHIPNTHMLTNPADEGQQATRSVPSLAQHKFFPRTASLTGEVSSVFLLLTLDKQVPTLDTKWPLFLSQKSPWKVLSLFIKA